MSSDRIDVAATMSWSREHLLAHQESRLAIVAEHAYANTRFYRQLWDQAGVTGSDLRSLADLRRFPVITKRDIGASQDADPPFGEHLAVAPSELSRTHVNTGPSSTSMQFDAVTAGDVQMAADIGELLFRIGGVSETDTVVNTRQFGFTPAGLFMQQSLEQIGANVAPMGLEDNRRLVNAVAQLRPTVIESFTTQCLRIAQAAIEIGIDPVDWSVQRLLIGGEPGGGSPAVRAELARLYGNPLILEYYGSAEVRLAGMECPRNDGMHLAEPFTVFELLDPDSFEPVLPGAEGVVVATSLYRWGSPMIRINTEDVATLTTEPCACGVRFTRIEKILGKRGGIVRAGGKNQYPEPIISAMRRFSEVERFRMLVHRESIVSTDAIMFEVEATSALVPEHLDRMRQEMRSVVDVEPGVPVELRQVPTGTIPAEARFTPLVDQREGVYA